jgi:spermidine synthase
MNTARMPPLSVLLAALILVGSGVGLWYVLGPSTPTTNGSHRRIAAGGDEQLELDAKSMFSRIKVTKDKVKNVRTLWFVRDNGDEVIESMLNLDKPHDLIVNYTRFMFLSYAFRPKQEKVLIVGLGGGSMVHFLKHYDPNVKVDVVEIDPKIVEVADKYFGVRTGGNVNIITKDAFDYLAKTDAQYDTIYMDAFLKPSVKTDETGVDLRFKTMEFYKKIQKKLTPDGMVVFNINGHDKIDDDLKNIRDSFSQTYIFNLPYESLVVVGSTAQKRLTGAAIRQAATELDQRFKTSYSYQDMAKELRK